MHELWYWNFEAWCLVGQYPTKQQAILIGKDYLRRGFRAQVRDSDGKVAWESNYNPRCAIN